jgi:hypothetical protein
VIDELEGDGRPALEVGRAVPGLVHHVPVDQQEDVVAEVRGQQHPARAHVHRVQRVLGHHAEAEEVDGLVERVDAIGTQLAGVDRRRGGGRRALILELLRGRRHHGLVERALQIREVGGRRGRRPRGQQQHRRQRPPHGTTLARPSTW